MSDLMRSLLVVCVSSAAGLGVGVARAELLPILEIAPYAMSDSDVTGGASAYRAWLENGSWSGDLIEYTVNADGSVTTDVPIGATPAESGSVNWSASAVMAAREAADAGFWQDSDGRRIVTWNGIEQVAFRWSSLGDAQREALDPSTAASDAEGPWDSALLNFVRGERDNEGSLRERRSLLGDIRGSRPVFVGAALGGAPRPDYPAFATALASRAPRLYVGGNDGMLHALDASSGEEVWAYAPSPLFATYRSLASPHYLPTRYVDGEPGYGEVRIEGNWRSVLAGGYGAGARGLYALDVTSPELSDETADDGANRKLMWETPPNDPRIGHVAGRPLIAELADGTSWVIAGNGPGSNDGHAELLLISLDDGTVTSIDTGEGVENGLAAPALADDDGDGVADLAYAGDLMGNLWRFDLSAGTAHRLFDADEATPFTSAPELALHPSGGRIVYVASGAWRDEADADTSDTQAVFAVRDAQHVGAAIVPSDLAPGALERVDDWRLATAAPVDWSEHAGWRVVLDASGERVLGAPTLRDGRLQFVSVAPLADAWFLQLDWLDGGPPDKPLFDRDENGALGATDALLHDDVLDWPVGRRLGPGAFSQPIFARVANGRDLVLINGLLLPNVTSCSGDCVGGLIGGHVDVDTDTVLHGGTDAHVHEYDDRYDVTYVDLLGLQPPDGGSLDRADAVGIDPSTALIAVLANADFSPGGSLIIGDKRWSVLAYQQMVQAQLTAWDGFSTLLDDDGEPLAFSLGEIATNGGELRIDFDDQAIANGGLHPTVTGCVRDSDAVTNGRWRNGSLTLQLIEKETLLPGSAANNVWVAQTPADLVPGTLGGGVHANPANPAGFRYESTLFWHHDGSCYGEADWATTVLESQAAILAEQLIDVFPVFGDDDAALEILTLLAAMDEFECDAGIGEQCVGEDEYAALIARLNELVGDYRLLLAHMGGAGSSDGTPAVPEDQSATLHPAEGPAFTFGRRNWIDLHR